MDTDSVYTGLQKPAQDVYETVTRRAEREPGGEQTRQSRSRSCVSISLGVTVCVLLVTVIALGTVLWKQNSSDWERKLEKKEEELEKMKSELEGNQNKSATQCNDAETHWNDTERYRSEAERYRSEADRYRKQLEKFCVDPSTGKRKQQCCPEGWKGGDSGRCYYVSTDQRSWVSANQSCSSVGAQLLVINDKKELPVCEQSRVSSSVRDESVGMDLCSTAHRQCCPTPGTVRSCPLCAQIQFLISDQPCPRRHTAQLTPDPQPPFLLLSLA
ncbi:oxidized low-density lipoprotein receptor 1-like isoform X4 [Lepisosteus oculatus]|uniref:oxidized low-density lipoprotein receptor 1-like isoform X4 n=1 Tax=Lepisosteus oculatus TaxID=7918 RepID=UPI0035F510FB